MRSDTRSNCEQGVSRKNYPTVSCMDCETDTPCSLIPYFEGSKYVCKMFASEAHVCETTLWNTRYSSLRTLSVLISDSSGDRAVFARFSDDSICVNRNISMQSSRTPESQQADIAALAPGDALNAVRMLVRPLSWSLSGLKLTYFDMKVQLNIHQTTGLPALKRFIWNDELFFSLG